MKIMILALLSSVLILLLISNSSDFEMQKHWMVLVILFPAVFLGSVGAMGACSGWR